MFKGKSEQIELGIIGFIIGAVLGFNSGIWVGVHVKTSLNPVTIGYISGFVAGVLGVALFGILLGRVFKRQSANKKLYLKLGLAGVLIGGLIGGSFLKDVTVIGGIVLGVIIGVILYTFILGSFINAQRAKEKYLSFAFEGSWYLYVGLFGVTAWLLTYSAISDKVPFNNLGMWTRALYNLLIPFALALILTTPVGFIFAANRQRPIVGGLLSFLGGVLVLWVGISLAPILVMPGSGLYWAGLIIGLLMCAFTIMAMVSPRQNTILGSVIIVLSILSLLGAAGGLIVGCISGIIGGALIVAWNGVPEPQTEKKDADVEVSRQELPA
ncbi:MAG: DUF6114 domain-containing protein [Bacillota bacterium]